MAEAGVSELQANFQVHVMEFPAQMEDLDGQTQAAALIVLRRRTGYLLAVPRGAFTEAALAAGTAAPPEEMVGQSTLVTVAAGSKESLEDAVPPVHEDGTLVDVVLVDVSDAMDRFLSPFDPLRHHVELLLSFSADNIMLMPMPEDLAAEAWSWVADPASGERAIFYSAAEEDEAVPETPAEEEVDPPQPGRRGPSTRSAAPRGAEPGTQKKPRATVATLAASMETMSSTLPVLVNQLTELKERTEAMEQRLSNASPGRPSALQQPLGSFNLGGSLRASTTPAALLKEMPPPRGSLPGTSRPTKQPASQEEAQQLMSEKEVVEDSADLAKAVYAQSQALTALVSHLTNADPIHDLSASSSGLSSKGSAGRMRLQQELAQHRGTFYLSVLQAMARRMQPARVAEQSPQELAARGVVPTAYVERYGGYGRSRELGSLMWQVAIIMDHLQTENYNAAKDATALLATCLEQAALDGGKMDLALLLSLAEDPPSGVFTNRNLSGVMRGRAFAPLAEQKWITIALAYVKEMDLISSRRQDLTGKPERSTAETPGPKKQPNKKQKGKGKGNQTSKDEDAE
eukprot:s1300_g18.t1